MLKFKVGTLTIQLLQQVEPPYLLSTQKDNRIPINNLYFDSNTNSHQVANLNPSETMF